MVKRSTGRSRVAADNDSRRVAGVVASSQFFQDNGRAILVPKHSGHFLRMLFNSFTFLLFFAVILGVYGQLQRWNHRKIFLLVASYFFYAAWNPPFVAILWFSTAVDWYCARHLPTSSKSGRRCLLMVSLLSNLGVLAFFKYSKFAATVFSDCVALFGIAYEAPEWSIILPVGISFFTFQSMSYTLDVYHGRMKPGRSLVDFALYVTFFPQLVAGPIVRASEFLPQCENERRASRNQIGWGLCLLVIGIFQKTVADGFLAPVADLVFRDDHAASFASLGTAAAWLGTLAFAGQIYLDFAGYSTSAIGVAMCFGFSLPDNFRSPYAAIGFSDFWRRWHISLSTWLRDYVYIPMGGSHRGERRTLVSLFVTMLLGGLWHGAGWTFVIWGAVHGLLLALERGLRRTSLARWELWASWFGKTLLRSLTFIVVCLTWVLFRSADLPAAMTTLQSMLSMHAGTLQLTRFEVVQVLVPLSALLGWQSLTRDHSLESVTGSLPNWLIALAITLMLTVIALMPGEDRAFIYFQF